MTARILLAFLVLLAASPARAESSDDLTELKSMVMQMQQTINQLNSRIADLESAKPSPTSKPKPASPTSADDVPQADEPEEETRVGHPSLVTNRGALNDQQEAASRPLDFTLNPEFEGFIPIPNSPIGIKLNAKPRMDMTSDNRNAGARSRFIPAKFPLRGDPDYGGGQQFNMNANGTQLRADVRAFDMPGNFRFYYQNDFFGDDDKDMRYRLQHIYGQYYGFKAGFTYSAWENPDIWPDTVDYEGPNAVIFARRPIAQYTHAFNDSWNSTIGVEKPDIFVDGGTKLTRIPDLAFNTRWENDRWGHVQASTILRSVGARDSSGGNHHQTGWGFNLGGNINLTDSDAIQILGVYGEGIGGMGNDTSFLNSDGGFEADGSFTTLPYWSLMVGYTHRWTDSLRSTLSYGHANLDPASGQDPDFYSFSRYGSANFIWQIRPRWSLGIEGLYGYKEGQSGKNSGDMFRLQVGMAYSIFD